MLWQSALWALASSYVGCAKFFNGVTSLIHILVLVFVAASFSKELVELGHQLVNRSLFLVERCFDAVKKILIGLKKATARRG